MFHKESALSTSAAALAALLFFLPLSAQAWAAPACVDPGPGNAESLMQWKRDLIDQFDKAVYLDANDAAITEDQFFQALREKRRPFHMRQTIVEGRKTRIVLQLQPQDGNRACA